MGASKRLMEEVVFWHANHSGSLLGGGESAPLPRVACTRFANVAFSDGSLLAGYLFRIRKFQPLAGPNDVRRYFITEEEAGQLCLMTAALANNKEIFIPRLDPDANVKSFDEIAEIVLESCGFKPRWYDSDEEARAAMNRDVATGYYPCAFSTSDTSGEKNLEEFVGPGEHVADSRFSTLDVIDESPMVDDAVLAEVLKELKRASTRPESERGKRRIFELVSQAVPTFQHIETGRDLDQKM
jgi:FlaA1/EpsC-like NDP-sugar epimerase